MNDYATESRSEERPRVLIVDDEENIIEILSDFFGDRPYTVETAPAGDVALEMLRNGGFDIILTDINLPGISGLELLAAAKEADPDVVVVIMTGFASTGSAIQALREGAFEYVTKPFDLFDVDNIVTRGLESRQLVIENRRLLQDLQVANDELRRHEEHLKEKIAQATRKIKTLYEIGKDVNATLDVNRTLDFIVEQAAGLTGARMGLLFRKRENTQSLVAEVGHGPAAAWKGKAQVRVGEGANGRVLADLHPARLETDDPSSWGESFLEELGVHSLLTVPLIHKGSLIGLLDVMDKTSGQFTEQDQELLSAFASQAAMALGNAELFEHTRELDRLKSDFVAVVSHEVRTPLTSIQGSLELVLEHGSFDGQESIKELLEICQTNVGRLRVLIGDILDFSKIERDRLPMEFEPLHIRELAEHTVAAMSHIARGKDISLDLVIAGAVPVIRADRVRVGQVLTNLVDNAIKFSPDGSRVELAVKPHRDGGIYAVVTDTGPGIAKEDLGKLFQKFQQIDSALTRKQGGLGLGLVISKGIVEGHGGRIWVESGEGQGCRFCFILPSEPPRPRNADPPMDQAAA